MSYFINYLKTCLALQHADTVNKLGVLNVYHVQGTLQHVIDKLEEVHKFNNINGIPARMVDLMKLGKLRHFYIRDDTHICFDSNNKKYDDSMKPIDDMFNKFNNDINVKYRDSEIEIDKLCKNYIGTFIRKPSEIIKELVTIDIDRCNILLKKLDAIKNADSVDLFTLIDDTKESDRNIKNLIIRRFGTTVTSPLSAIHFLVARCKISQDTIAEVKTEQVFPTIIAISKLLNNFHNDIIEKLGKFNKLRDMANALGETNKATNAINNCLYYNELTKLRDSVWELLRPECCNCWKECSKLADDSSHKAVNDGYASAHTPNNTCNVHMYCQDCKHLLQYGCQICKYEQSLEQKMFERQSEIIKEYTASDQDVVNYFNKNSLYSAQISQ